MSRIWLPFRRNNAPIVSISIGSSRHFALVDTGATHCLIMPEVALRLGLPREGTMLAGKLGGPPDALPIVQLPEIQFAAINLPACQALVRNLASLGLNVEFILGVNAFANRRLQFDFKEGRVYLLE
jgi:predicted aspartyl protease